MECTTHGNAPMRHGVNTGLYEYRISSAFRQFHRVQRLFAFQHFKTRHSIQNPRASNTSLTPATIGTGDMPAVLTAKRIYHAARARRAGPIST
eukprot:scaffold395127_cov18-Prasinocladus_malaysianus.AAC.1